LDAGEFHKKAALAASGCGEERTVKAAVIDLPLQGRQEGLAS